MKIRILLFFFALTLLTANVCAGRGRSGGFSGGSRGGSRSGSSWGSSSRSSSSGGRTTGSSSYGSSSSGGRTTGSSSYGSSSSGGRTTGSSSYGSSSSGGRTTGSSSYGSSSSGSSSFGYGSSWGGHTGSNPVTHGSSSSGHMTGSSPVGYRPSSDQTSSHQQNKASSTSFLQAEGGGATRPSQTKPTSGGPPSVPNSNIGINLGSQGKQIGFSMDKKQNSAPPVPSDHISRPVMMPSQNHAPTAPGQSSTPFNPSHGTVSHNNPWKNPQYNPSQSYPPTSNNPAWSNPHYNPSQSYPPTSNNPAWNNPHYNPSQSHPPPLSTNIGFKDHLRPTSMPVSSAPYPRTSYPGFTSNQHPPPYPVHPSGYQPHSTSFNPSHSIGHPASYPAHVPPPVPGTFGNPYATYPVGSAYSSTGHSYYPQQQHMLAQPAAQPYIPGHTVITVPVQQDSGRGFGQMVKEALVFSTINAGVNRLINPHHHYVSSSSVPASSTTSETHITYNNHYFNGVPTGNTPVVPPSPSQGSASYPVNNPSPVNNPVITPGVSIPTIVSNNGVANSTGSSVDTTSTTNSMAGSSAVPPNGYSANNIMSNQGTSDQWASLPQYKISDAELSTLTEELFALQEFDVSEYLTLNLQNATKSSNITDEAKEPLIRVQPEVYEYPTILAIRSLYDNYEHNSSVKETRTVTKRKEEDLLLDVFLNTNVMARALRWLSVRGFIDPDDFERKDVLRHIWFGQFDGATSGFERVFTSERYGHDLLGVQDWIYFEYQESRNRIDYKGYVDTLKLGKNAQLVKLNFQMDDIIRPNATIFVGTLPELEMSLYTVCFFARPNDLCPVSLGGSKFNIYTHAFRYYGKDLIDLALPIF